MSGKFFGFAAGPFLRFVPGLFGGFLSGFLFGFPPGAFFGFESSMFCCLECGLLFGGPAPRLFLRGEPSTLCRFAQRPFSGLALGLGFHFALGLLFGLAPHLFLVATGVRVCCLFGPQLRLFGVDRVPLGEGFPLLGETGRQL